ncbi:hypothetical protein J4234_05565 [Candidatus Woesearchaeota archaeon]|nr:hypothetical protein [Candidatus Woesearchaeota archaeon]
MEHIGIVQLVKESLQKIHLDSGAPLAEFYIMTYAINGTDKKIRIYRINGRKMNIIGELKFPAGLEGSLEIEGNLSRLRKRPMEVTSRMLMQNAQALHGITDYLAQNGFSVSYA